MRNQNLLRDLKGQEADERFDDILKHKGVRIERIVSNGHASQPGFWYQQAWDEWVLIIKGSAVLAYDHDSIEMNPGDHVLIPAGKRHRVQATSHLEPTVWLAIHWSEDAP